MFSLDPPRGRRPGKRNLQDENAPLTGSSQPTAPKTARRPLAPRNNRVFSSSQPARVENSDASGNGDSRMIRSQELNDRQVGEGEDPPLTPPPCTQPQEPQGFNVTDALPDNDDQFFYVEVAQSRQRQHGPVANRGLLRRVSEVFNPSKDLFPSPPAFSLL